MPAYVPAPSPARKGNRHDLRQFTLAAAMHNRVIIKFVDVQEGYMPFGYQIMHVECKIGTRRHRRPTHIEIRRSSAYAHAAVAGVFEITIFRAVRAIMAVEINLQPIRMTGHPADATALDCCLPLIGSFMTQHAPPMIPSLLRRSKRV